MKDWLDGYEHAPINAGLDWTPGTPWKVCLHTTETRPAPGLIDHWRRDPGSGLPHFLGITPDRIVQLLPLTVGAYTSQNPAGGIDTNRAHLIQIEVCEYAANAPTWSAPGAPWCRAIGRWLADLNGALDGALDLTTELEFGRQWVGFPGGAQAYLGYRGVLGHQHMPEQPDRHWDPGPIDIAAILAAARGQQEDDMPLTDDDAVKVAQATAKHLAENDAFLTAVAVKVGRLVGGQSKAEGQAWAKDITNLGDAINATLKTAVGGGVDPDAVAAAVVDDLADRLANG